MINKLTMCEVLGVEMLETFQFREHKYAVDEDGTLLEYYPEKGAGNKWSCADSARICEIIKCADEIKRIAIWFERDEKDAEAALRLFPNAEKVRVGITRNFVQLVLDTGQVVQLTRGDAFPSIKTNSCFYLDEILGVKMTG